MYITILFIIIMIATILIIAKQKTLSKSLKGFVITMLLLALSVALLFEYVNSQSDKKYRPTITAFKQGKTLDCASNKIDNTTYSYEPGTSSFQPLINVVGETFSLRECIVSP